MLSFYVSGQSLSASAGASIIEAMWHAGIPRVEGVGCLSGACGSCRVLVRRSDGQVVLGLACQMPVSEGMKVIFLPRPTPSDKKYSISSIGQETVAKEQLSLYFPEASNCRHCGGCNVVCPMKIDVEKGVKQAIEGMLADSALEFYNCIQCDLCNTACPENIEPNYVGVFVRRVIGRLAAYPPGFLERLHDIECGRMKIEK